MHHASAVGAQIDDHETGFDVREDVGGIAMFAVDKGFSLFVAVARDGAAMLVVVCMGCSLNTYS